MRGKKPTLRPKHVVVWTPLWDQKGCNVLIVMEKVAFWDYGFYHILYCKNFHQLVATFMTKYVTKIFEIFLT